MDRTASETDPRPAPVDRRPASTARALGLVRAIARGGFEAGRIALRSPAWIWVVPFLVVPVSIALHYSPIAVVVSKPVQEIIAPTVIATATALAALAFRRRPGAWAGWLLALCVSLFARELHLPGTNLGFYIVFVILVLWACANFDRVHASLPSGAPVHLLVAALWLYLASKAFDRNYVAALPAYWVWHDAAEETLETVGHIFTAWLTLDAVRRRE